jgi:competence protein ComEA
MAGDDEAVSPTTTIAVEVVVHAAGAVAAPGLYHLPSGSRVADLLAAAGGATPDADVDGVNLAAPLLDGQRHYVPRTGEVPPPVAGDATPSPLSGGATGAPVNLNTASVAELDGLPGVGPTTAQAIIDHRSTHGPFGSVEELLDVRGIGDAKLEQLRGLVVI